jgi:hypothetical protein
MEEYSRFYSCGSSAPVKIRRTSTEKKSMLKAVEGIFREGKVELLETPPDVKEARVVVTFLPADGGIDLRTRGIGEAEAAALRSSWGAAAEDWDRPEMDVYNDL